MSLYEPKRRKALRNQRQYSPERRRIKEPKINVFFNKGLLGRRPLAWWQKILRLLRIKKYES